MITRALIVASVFAIFVGACGGAPPATPSGQTLDVPVRATAPKSVDCALTDPPAPTTPIAEKEAYLESLIAQKDCTQAYEAALLARFKGVKAVKADGKWMGAVDVDEHLTRCSLASKACYAEVKLKQPLADFEQVWAQLRASQKQGWSGIAVHKRGRPVSDLQGAKPCADGGACEIPLALVKLLAIKEPDTGVVEVNAPRVRSEAEKQAEIDDLHRAHKAEVAACVAKCKDAKCKTACETPPGVGIRESGF